MSNRVTSTQRVSFFDLFNPLHILSSSFSSSQPRTAAALLCTALLLAQSTTTLAAASGKRGLIDITTQSTAQQDYPFLTDSNSDLTWYYNYGPTASSFLADNKKLEFVPMCWGQANSGNFMNTVMQQINGGANITAVLSFNEPDGCGAGGGSCMQASAAAQIWKAQLEPLRAKGIKIGMPAITSSQTGLTWLTQFMMYCDGGCTPDFLSLHYYGDFQGFASWVGQMNATYPNITETWVTEFALANEDLSETQSYYNTTIDYLERLPGLARYSYFGSFRSSVSNVGPNVAMLNSQGNLTAIGSSYLGGPFSGAIPDAGSASTTNPTKTGAASVAGSAASLLTIGIAAVMGVILAY